MTLVLSSSEAGGGGNVDEHPAETLRDTYPTSQSRTAPADSKDVPRRAKKRGLDTCNSYDAGGRQGI